MEKNANIVSVVVFDKVKPDCLTAFEDWQNRINSKLKESKGFVSVSSKKLDDATNEYFTIYQFDSNETLQHWLDSDSKKKLLAEAKQYTLLEPKISLHQGLEIFFNKKETESTQPPFYKKVLIGIVAVYPLIIIVGKLTHWLIPGFGSLPFELGLFFEVIIISTLMTYPVMPLLTNWFHKWLFK